MRKIITLIVLLASQMMMAQDTNAALEKKAKDLANAYKAELALDASKATQLEAKIAEFLMRAEKIKAMDIPNSEKPFLLIKLNEQETEEMGNILSAKQLKKYVKAKQRLQPVQGVAPQ